MRGAEKLEGRSHGEVCLSVWLLQPQPLLPCSFQVCRLFSAVRFCTVLGDVLCNTKAYVINPPLATFRLQRRVCRSPNAANLKIVTGEAVDLLLRIDHPSTPSPLSQMPNSSHHSLGGRVDGEDVLTPKQETVCDPKVVIDLDTYLLAACHYATGTTSRFKTLGLEWDVSVTNVCPRTSPNDH